MLKKGDIINCIFDLCNGFRAKDLRSFEKKVKHDTRKWEKIFKKRKGTKSKIHFQSFSGKRHHHHHHHHKRRRGGFIFNSALVSPSRTVRRVGRVVRRRGRGDVWLRDANKKWVDVNAIGTFNYLKDNKINLNIFVQFGKLGRGSVLSAVAVSYKGKTIVAENDGSVTINGKLLEAPSAVFSFENNQFNVKADNSEFGIYSFTGILKEGFKIHYEKISKSYMIVIESTASHHKGLYVDPTHPAAHQIKKEESLFRNYISFEVLNKVVAKAQELKFANKCCSSLSETKKKECRLDFIRTGLCFIEQYKEDLEL